jgi:putative ABC transport system permease protein
MISRDLIGFTLSSAKSHRLRSGLTALGIGIGVTAVVLLTSIGEGLQKYVLSEFSQFGTNIILINPGRPETFGHGNLPLAAIKPLTLDDARALERVPYVSHVAGVVQGNAEIEGNGRSRRTLVTGTSPSMPQVWSFDVALGEFLPPDDQRAPRALVVLGSKVRDELFGAANPLGEKVLVGGRRFRVVGVMESKGTVLGFDIDDAIYKPVVRGREMFNREGLVEIDVLYDETIPATEIEAGIRRLLIARHGKDDFTLTAQEQMIDVLGSVLDVVTFAIAGLGAIPLWLWLGRKIGKHRAFMCTLITVGIVSAANLLLDYGDYLPFFLLFVIKGFCFGGLQFLPVAMLADVVDVDAARSGSRRAGTYFAFFGFTEKLAVAFGTGISLVVVGTLGFDAAGGVAASTEMGVLSLRLVYCLGPVVFYGLALKLIWSYPLTPARHARLRERLDRRSARLADREGGGAEAQP